MKRLGVFVVALAMLSWACTSESAETTDAPLTTTPPPIAAPDTTAPPPTTVLGSTTTSATTVPTVIVPPACREDAMTVPAGSVVTFYSLCEPERLYPVYRSGEQRPSLDTVLSALVAGSTPEEHLFGLGTGFDWIEEADQVEVVADIDADGIAHIDFRIDGERWDPGQRASTSSQLISFLDPLLATVFIDERVQGVDHSTLCWGEASCGGITSRSSWEGIIFTNYGYLMHEGCGIEMAWLDPNRCTVDGAVSSGTIAATVTGVADDDVLNIRAGPGPGYFKHGELSATATLTATATTAPSADGAVWRLIVDDEWGAGWVNDTFLELDEA